MSRRPYDLPSLTTLAAFETAARHLSFKEAAGELNVTPGAVSHQIKALEADLGAPLFERRHRGVALTDPGQRLADALARGFGEVSGVVRGIRAGGETVAVSVAATTAVSSLWLTPRIARFWRKHGDVPVNQTLSDIRPRGTDPCDLRIHYGRIDLPDLHQTELFRDTLVAMCHPDLARDLGKPTLERLATQRLIHHDSPDTGWTTWRQWFARQGFEGAIASGMRVNNYAIALQCARDGAGVVLGWARLVSPLVDQGELVVLGRHMVPAPHGFHISHRMDEPLSVGAQMLKDWLLADV